MSLASKPPDVYKALLAIRMICAAFSIVMDCDEVFNYWEPTHFLTHGWGLQTWEYSPDYAIRSWAYVGIHASFIKIAEFVSKLTRARHVQLFLALRLVLAALSAAAETKLFNALYKRINSTVGWSYLAFSAFSTGMFHASISYLPSSFAMYCVTMAMASSLELTHARKRLLKSIFWIALGGLLGWPFVLVLALPFVLEYTAVTLFVSQSSNKFKDIFQSALYCLFIFFSVLVPIVLVDSLIYKKLVIVPWNIVSYNVLNAKSDMGPEIFGTEPWTYYILNLLTNFNVLFPLAAISLLLSFGYRLVVMPLALWKFKQEKSEKKRPTITQYIDLREGSKVVSGTPLWLQTIFYLWLSIVIVQPHKEERFLYVIYPAICVNAAISLQICMSTFRPFARVCAASVLFTTILLSTLRSTALATYYRAPSSLYSHLEYEASPASICVGREWYRYQSSYFLQDNQRLKFIKSGFDGLLPGEFDESPHFGWDIPGAYRVPQGMNNRNQEDKGKYVDKDQCDYVVDISSPVNPAAGEVLYTSSDQWDKVYCAPFLDSNASSGIGRILWIPARLHGVFRTNLVWTEYCLLRRNSKPL